MRLELEQTLRERQNQLVAFRRPNTLKRLVICRALQCAAMKGVILVVVLLLATGAAVGIGAQEAFTPPTPDGTDEFDWVQLTSGEWLEGEFLRMYRNEVTFDSDELDELTLDWEDVAIVRTARPMALLLRGEGTLDGRLEVDGDSVQVSGDVEVSIPRARVVSITNGSQKEIDHWVLGTELDVEVTGSIDFSSGYRLQWINELSGTYNHHMVTGFEFELTKRVDLDVSLV